MKRINKLIATLLALVLIMSAMPLTAFADNRTDASGEFESSDGTNKGYWYYTAATDTLFIDGYEEGVIVKSYDDLLTTKYTEHYLPTTYVDDNGVTRFWNESFSHLELGNHIAKLSNVCLGYDNNAGFYLYPDLKSVEYGDDMSLSAFGTELFYKSSIKSIEIPDSVETIGERCFSNSAIEEIVVPSSVTTISSEAFLNCKSLKTAVINANIKKIDSYMFIYDSALKSVTLPDSITTIGSYAFKGCTSLNEIDIPNSVSTIQTYAFFNTSINSITLPNSIKTIGKYAFADGKLNEVIFPSSNNKITISAYAFRNNNIASLEIPGNVTTIDTCAFYNAGIKSLVLDEGIQTISSNAFENDDFTTLDIPSTVTSIGSSAFKSCKSLTTVNAPNLKKVSSYLFSGDTALESVNMPMLRYISEYAFENTGIKSIEMASSDVSSGNTFVGSYAFYGCSNLSSVKLADDLASISPYAFYKCLSLRNVVVPKSVMAIYDYAFAYTSLGSIEILNSSAEIEDNNFIIGENIYDSDLVIKSYSPSTAETFANNNGIGFEALEADTEDKEDEKEPEVDETEIAENTLKGVWANGTWKITNKTLTFYGEGNMKSNVVYDLNGKRQTVADLVLANDISNIVIKDGITSVADKFVYVDENTRVDCLQDVTVAKSVESIGDYAFANTGIRSIGNELCMQYSNVSNQYAMFSSTLTHIGKYAFANTVNLSVSFIIPMDITYIEEGTFYNSSVKYVGMFGKVTGFGKKAFANCDSLTSLEVPCSVTDIYIDSENPSNNSFGYNDNGEVYSGLEVLCRKNSVAYDYINSNNIGFTEYEGSQYAMGKFTAVDDYSSLANKISKKTYTLYWNYYAEDNQLRIYASSDATTKYDTGLRTKNAEGSYTSSESLIISALDSKEEFFNYINGKQYKDYDGSLEVDKIVVEEGVTDISASDLFASFNPKTIQLPSTLTSLDYYAFRGCDRLTAVNIPNGVKTIDAKAFEGCTSLKGVNFGNGLTAIPDGLFENINTLQIVGIGSGVKSIGSRAFYNCTSLEQIDIPDSVVSIGTKAFYNNIKAQSISLGSGVTIINDGAFSNCVYCERINVNSNLASEYAGNGFKDVGNYTNGVTLNYGSDATSVDFKIFNDVKVTDISLGDSVSSVTNTQYLPNAKSISVGENNSNYYVDSKALYTNSNALAFVPPAVSDVTIKAGTKAIGDYACYGTSATNIQIPTGVELVGNYAFANSKTLRNIDILKGVTSIGNNAFENCTSLRKFFAPTTLTSIGNGAFKGCSALANVIPSTKLKTIGDEAFMGCTSLVGTVIEENVESIGDRAYKDCTNLEEIYIWYNTTLGEDVFQNDDKLTIYTIAGSDAYRYAREYNINYSAYVDEDSFYDLCGDKMNILAGYLGYCTDGHGDIDYLTVYSADCENDGYIIGVCEYCSEILDEVHVDATGHNYKLTTQIVPTSTTRGMNVYTCINCGQSFCNYIEPTGEDTNIETHSVTARVVIASNKKATSGKSPAKNVSVAINDMVVATTDNDGYFTLELETGSYEAELRYAYGFTRTIFIVVEDEDIEYEDPIAIIGCDFNKDGKIDDEDLELFQMVVSSKADDPSYLEFVDMNNDGYINAKDRVYITSCKGIDTSGFKYDSIVIQK